MKKVVFIFLFIFSLSFAHNCEGSLEKDVVYWKKYELVFKKIQVAVAYNDPKKALSYYEDLLKSQEVIKHISDTHLNELDNDSLSMMLEIKTITDQMLRDMKNIEEILK